MNRVFNLKIARIIGFIPLCFLLFTIPFLINYDSVSYESAILLKVLNTFFLSLIPLAIVYLASKSYLSTAFPPFLATGCGLFSFALSNLFAGWVMSMKGGGPNATVTLHNVGCLLSGAFHFISAYLLLIDIQAGRFRNKTLLIASVLYFCLTIFFVMILYLVFTNNLPVFFDTNLGHTALRQLVLGSAIVLFVFSSLVFMGLYLRLKTVFAYWFSLALMLIAIGLLCVFLQNKVGSLLGWTGRFSQYLGGVYFFISFIFGKLELQKSILHDSGHAKPIFWPFIEKKILEEVSSLQKLNDALKESEERYRAIVLNAPMLVAEVDCNGVIKLINKCSEGFEKNRVIETSSYDYIIDDGKEVFRKALNEVFTTKKPQRIVVKGLGNYKDIRWFETVLGPIIINGNVQSAIQISTDITDRIRTEEALRNTQKLDSLGVLAGGIAHDFNNLFSGIFGLIEIANDNASEKAVKNSLSKALETMDRARNLTQQLLTFAKGGAPACTKEAFFPFIQTIANFAISGSNVSLRFDIKDNLWLGNFDKAQIGQAIENIILNAVQSMPNGGNIFFAAENLIVKQNQIATLVEGDYVKFTIKDAGVGITSDILPKIFDPFFSTKELGRGLGLSTSYSIIKRHHGAIDVISQSGVGSTFFIYLPAIREKIDKIVNVSNPMHIGQGKILVMDDEEIICELIGVMLMKFGYSVMKTSNGLDALEVFKQVNSSSEPFVAVMLDLTIPGGVGGKETVEGIRKINKDIPVFVVSGYGDDPAMVNPKEYLFTDSIRKPFKVSELSELLEKNLAINK